VSAQAVRTRTKRPEVRRDQLLDAAEKLFAEKGYAETTVLDIAEAAGVAKGTFYLYFPSKEHCVIALKERLMQGLVDRFEGVLNPALEQVVGGVDSFDIEGVTRRLMDETFAHALEHAEAFDVLFHRGDAIEIDELSQAHEATITKLIADVITQMNILGIAQVSHPMQTARILFNGVHWALDIALCREGVRDLTELKEAAVEVSIRALSGPAPAAQKAT
jgi:AcrR family transcriptional regulator